MNQYVFEAVKPVVETKFGKLRGVTYGDVNIFMGVKYADAKRFQLPVEQQPWEGVKNAYTHGPVSPLVNPTTPFSLYRGLHLLQRHDEDCLNLNIWAPKTLNGEKKPVFVWMHGGGYFAGNALEEYSFDGFNLAHYGDIIFVSINHRLNLVGYLNLADYGEEYKNSVNAGIADLVAALKWIHENIAAFGGDPENVTICGHSGGGGKVQCMYQIEEAKDYFQRGMVLSGALHGGDTNANLQESTRAFAKSIMDELGITKDNINKINELPLDALYGALKSVSQKTGNPRGMMSLSPIQDDYYYGSPLDVGFAPWSKDKPFVIGSVLGEFPRVRLTEDEKLALTEEGKMEYLRSTYGEHTDELVKLFHEAYPTHDVFDLAYLDTMVRIPSLQTALTHAKNGLNNTRIFIGTYNSVENGSIPIWHGGEVGYMFMNEDRVYILNEAVYGQKYGNIFSSIAINYTKYGDPSNKYLPEWKPITEEHQYTMVIDKECELKESYDDKLMEAVLKYAPPFRFSPV